MVTSMLAVFATSAWTLGWTLLGWKYEPTRLFRLRALPTYRIVPCASSMRYTPGRAGKESTKPLASNGGGVTGTPSWADSAFIIAGSRLAVYAQRLTAHPGARPRARRPLRTSPP